MTDELNEALSSVFGDIAGWLSFLKQMGCDGVERRSIELRDFKRVRHAKAPEAACNKFE